MNELFYRVEDEEGRGPYTYIDGREPKIFDYTVEYYTTEDYLNRVPTPKADGFPDANFQDVDFVRPSEFGFNTKEQVQRWFTSGEFQFLEDNGFHLYLVYGKPLHKSENQVQYIRDKTKQRVMVAYD
jgi:hypothetical protein